MSIKRRTTYAASNNYGRINRYVLIVDSDADSLSYTASLLDRFKYGFLKAATAEEALAITKVTLPSLVIIALHLTDMSGFELMQQLKQDPDTAAVPLLGLNRLEDLNMKKRCFELGAVGCLYQPVEAETLYRAVQVAAEKNPRTSMRSRTIQPVKVNNMPDDSLYGAYTLDLSERGMFLRTMNSVPVHTRFSLQIEVDARIITIEAVVLYSCRAGEGPYREPGIGLEFVRIDPQDQKFIREFIRNEVTRGIAPGNE